MPPNEPRSLRSALHRNHPGAERWLWGAHAALRLTDLFDCTSLGAPVGVLHRRSVLLVTGDALAAAAALIELDGVCGRIILCPPDLAREHLPYVASVAAADAVVSDRADISRDIVGFDRVIPCCPTLMPASDPRPAPEHTEWVLFTSGTSGLPKMVVHSLASLAGAIRPGAALSQAFVWATFYDIRRFGGLQIFLRAVLGGGSLVLGSVDESIDEFLVRAGSRGATHVTGTPSHWRRVLMSPAAHVIAPEYVRLSGEIAEQAILDALQRCYPRARVAHAFATTEAGVAFEVNDGHAGFPAALSEGKLDEGVEMMIADGTLRIRSPRTARRYLDEQSPSLLDSTGFVDTGDLLELRDGRYYFAGRRSGIINVGGLKVHPEEVEAVINRDPRVRMSRVQARKNRITGALVVADVVLCGKTKEDVPFEHAVKEDILAECRRSLPAHKVPAVIRFVASLPLTPAGKVARSDA